MNSPGNTGTSFVTGVSATDMNMIWFGIIVVLVTAIGLITPPIGMNAFGVKSVLLDVRRADIFRGAVPYVVALITGLLLVYFMPGIATLLPGLAR